MRLLLIHIFRNIRKNWLSVLLEIVSIALAVSVIYIALNASDDVIQATKDVREAYSGSFDLSLSPRENPVPFEAIDFGEGNKAVPVSYNSYDLPKTQNPGMEDDLFTLVLSTELETLEERGLFTLTEGHYPEKDGEVLITKEKAKLLNLGLGFHLVATEEDSGETHSMVVTGILDNVRFLSNSRPDLIECYTFYSSSAIPYRIFVDAEVPDLHAYEEELKKEALDWSVSLVEDDDGSRRSEESLVPILFLLVAITTALSLSVIITLNVLKFQNQLSVFATFRSIGASLSVLRKLLYGENLIYGVLGGLLGAGGGELVRAVLIKGYLLSSPTGRHIHPLYLAFVFVLALVLELLTATAASHKLSQSAIHFTLKEKAATAVVYRKGPAFLGLLLLISGIVVFVLNKRYLFPLLVFSLFSVIAGTALLIPLLVQSLSRLLSRSALKKGFGPLFLSLRNMSSTRSSVSTVRLITLVIALAVTIVFSVSSIGIFFQKYEKNYDWDIYIKGIDLSLTETTYIQIKEGVLSVTKEYWKRESMTLTDTKARICFVRNDGYINGITILNGNKSDLKKGTIIMDAVLAQKNHYKVGDTVTIPWEDKEPSDFLLVGLCDSGIYDTTRNTIILSSSDYKTFIGSQPTRIDLKLRKSQSIEKTLERLKLLTYLHLDKDIQVGTKDSTFGVEWAKTKSALSMLATLPALVLFFSLIGIVNNGIMVFRQRKNSYAVLYSVAASNRQLCTMVFLENALGFLLGTVLGLLLGILTTLIMQGIIYSLIAYIEIKIKLLELVLPLLGAGILLIAVALIPCYSMRHLSITEEIRNE
ncbi:MAG: FtsX-like permease family protein [Spirochaetales bacterium]|nr:FtsX-like permease family protein [Candidatus Physcosoma equi]